MSRLPRTPLASATLVASAALVAGAVSLAGCTPPVPEPPKIVAAPAPAAKPDPCRDLHAWERDNPPIVLDGSERTARILKCARFEGSGLTRVSAKIPDLSAIPRSYRSLTLDLDLADTDTALATLPAPSKGSHVSLTCLPSRKVSAKTALAVLSSADGAWGTCLPVGFHRLPWDNPPVWYLSMSPELSRVDFDAVVAFAKTHATVLTLNAASLAWIDALEELPPPSELGVACASGDSTVDLGALAKLESVKKLTFRGPCRLQPPEQKWKKAPFQGVTKLSWEGPNVDIDVSEPACSRRWRRLTLEEKHPGRPCWRSSRGS
ncbi:MAG: hypothetical protein R3F14_42725 [Polyangiaceae bacterium]